MTEENKTSGGSGNGKPRSSNNRGDYRGGNRGNSDRRPRSGGNRGNDSRGPRSDKPRSGKPYGSGNGKPGYGKPYGSDDRRSGNGRGGDNRRSGKPYGNDNRRSGKPYGNDDRRSGKPYGSDDRRSGKSYGNDDRRSSKSYGSDERRPRNDKPRSGKPYGNDDRRNRSDKPYKSDDRGPHSDKRHDSDKPRSGKSFGGNGGKRNFDNARSGKPYGSGERRDRSDKPRSGKSFSSDDRKRSFDKPRSNKPYNKNGGNRKFDKPRSDRRFDSDRRDSFGKDDWNKRDGDDWKPKTDGNVTDEVAVPQTDEETQNQSRKWEPNRERKAPTSKKAFDQKKVEHLLDDDKPVYKGELDPREKDPNRKPRSISRSEELVMRKAEALAEKDPSIQARRVVKITDFRDQYERCDASPGRLGALYATQQVRKRDAFAQDIIESTIDRSTISAQDRAFATLLTLGVVSTSGALDEVINRCISNPRDIQPDVRDAMRISTYEIIYLRKAPHAALDQGVELVRAVAPAAAGLANAVLHRVLSCAELFPFGDPTISIDALALTYAFPTWLAQQLIDDMGSAAAIELMRSANEQAPVFIHVNALQATDTEIEEIFEEAKFALEPAETGGITVPGCYRVPNARALADGRIRRLFQQGKILVSDAAAQAITACVLEGDKPGSVLEVGAGRGTKTIMLQSLAQTKYGDQLDLTSMDNIAFKSDVLRDRARDYGVKLDQIVTGNAARLDHVMPNQMFDLIFIDSPCSGLGTLRRHHEIRWRVGPNRIEELADTSLSLLKSAAGHVNEGGSIVYATCTVTYAENNGVVKRFLQSPEGASFTLAPINGKACFATQQTPGSADAHFAARFVKKQAADE